VPYNPNLSALSSYPYTSFEAEYSVLVITTHLNKIIEGFPADDMFPRNVGNRVLAYYSQKPITRLPDCTASYSRNLQSVVNGHIMPVVSLSVTVLCCQK
jgi:hypothetical protein